MHNNASWIAIHSNKKVPSQLKGLFIYVNDCLLEQVTNTKAKSSHIDTS